MKKSVSRDLDDSVSDVEEHVWPVLKEHFKSDGEFYSVEDDNSTLGSMLDMAAGIDYFFVQSDGTVLSFASRIQWDFNYRSFSIRKERASGVETEFEKRMKALVDDGEYPTYTVQAFIDEDGLLELGIAKTRDLIAWIIKNNPDIKRADDWGDGESAWFYVVPWDKLCSKVDVYS